MHVVCLIIYPRFQPMSLAVGTVFEYANRLSGRDVYAFRIASEHGGAVGSSLGFPIETIPLGSARADTLIVSGDNDCELPSPGLMATLARVQPSASRMASICTGSFVLAEMGLLDGRRATTYWAHAGQFRSRYPRVRLEEDKIYVTDGPLWTSAGMTAGLDMALAMIESDLGAAMARSVARHIVVQQRRGGAQSQFSVLLELDAKTDRIQKALAYAKENLGAKLSGEVLSEAANMSLRQFNRVFREETGQSPAKAVERLRVETARFLLETSAHPLATIARETGFGELDRMRMAFLRVLGETPRAMRRRWSEAERSGDA